MGITRYYPRTNHSYYNEICNDCGEVLILGNTDKSQRDICNSCWENRGWVVKHASQIGMEKFQEIQAAMRVKHYKAKALIEDVKKLLTT